MFTTVWLLPVKVIISIFPSLKSIMNMNEANGASGKEIIDLDSIK